MAPNPPCYLRHQTLLAPNPPCYLIVPNPRLKVMARAAGMCQPAVAMERLAVREERLQLAR